MRVVLQTELSMKNLVAAVGGSVSVEYGYHIHVTYNMSSLQPEEGTAGVLSVEVEIKHPAQVFMHDTGWRDRKVMLEGRFIYF